MVPWKLRDIEILVQQQLEENEKGQVEDTTLLEIQKILYSTEVGNHIVQLFIQIRF